MEEQKFSFKGSFQKTKEYIETQVDLLKLRAIVKSARISGVIALDLMKLLLSLIIIFFLSLSLGFFLGELMHSNALGFLITGVFFVIVLLIVIAKEPKLEAKFMNLVVKRIMSRWNEDEDLDINEKIKETHNANKKKAQETRVEDFYESEVSENENKN